MAFRMLFRYQKFAVRATRLQKCDGGTIATCRLPTIENGRALR
jgi:hypothetical protein